MSAHGCGRFTPLRSSASQLRSLAWPMPVLLTRATLPDVAQASERRMQVRPAVFQDIEGGRHGEILSLGLPCWQSKRPMVTGPPGRWYGDASRSTVAGFRVVCLMG
ncbi:MULTISPECIES: hypothetical protein [unclassified Pseudomonas]|uniref:hypothetical protein n=1 Tax=unclassified Pseudomonas TaxID=196821 RepID=UPI0023E3C3F9|nr:hypothetical protein [Pseudomonas sp. D3]WET11769.1 hypothetical protein P3S72_06460 [Pseudomonas sp. D3]